MAAGLALRALILAIFFVPAVVVLTMRDADPRVLPRQQTRRESRPLRPRNLRLRSRRRGLPRRQRSAAATTMKTDGAAMPVVHRVE